MKIGVFIKIANLGKTEITKVMILYFPYLSILTFQLLAYRKDSESTNI